MRRWITGALLTASLLATGCASSGDGMLVIDENGSYDVSGYSEVYVDVEEDEDFSTIEQVTDSQTKAAPKQDTSAAVTSDVNLDPELVRKNFRHFSMQVPIEAIEDYVDSELTGTSSLDLGMMVEGGPCSLYICTMEIPIDGFMDLEDFSTAPQEVINGIPMAILNEQGGGRHHVEATFINRNVFYRVSLSYPVSQDDFFAEYSESFYRSIQLT